MEILKPRIVFGNLISSLGGFFLASKGDISYNLLFLNLISISLIVSASCIFNNIIDYKIDKHMNRTKKRILVTHPSFYSFSIFSAIFLGVLGLFLFGFFVNLLCMILAFCGFMIYVLFYSIILKTRSIYSTIVGSVSGAIPPVLGYCSVVNHINLCSVNLFLILFFWQIPHSYSIFIMHFNDYKNANIPVYPIIKPFFFTKRCVNVFIILFLISICFFTIIGCTGYKFLLILLFFSITWLYFSCKKYRYDKNNILWSKNVFYHSIFVMLILNFMMSIDFEC
ncbi:MAG: heme o synthase [Buchnera aphidicola (Nurudea yanoniella)]